MNMGRRINVGLHVPGVDGWVWVRSIPVHINQWTQFLTCYCIVDEILQLSNTMHAVINVTRSVVWLHLDMGRHGL